MKTVSKRELNQQTAQVLADVRAGAPVLVAERGVVRWRIELIDRADDPIARLRAEGRIRPADGKPPAWPEEAESGYSTRQIEALFNEMRGDR